MPEIGSLAPDFTLPADDGSLVTLSSLRGRPVVVYFYPRDDTPGCTTEACDFRDRQAQLAVGQGAVVLGISGDSLAAHQKFKKKYDLNFALLSDADKALMRAWGVFGKKIMYGKEVEGVIRSTFVIDRDGKVAAAWKKVSVKGHADAVLAELAKLS